ncbi:MAG: hypothetical protein ACSHW7_09640 [Patiriisocius sp.]|uniref:hypothetical protein n=1 Tax=Patiriisocius sp. TaxID=2822396 RepID=UPI003EF8C4EC
METGMIVIAIILVLVCTMPFILIKSNTKKRERQLKKALVNAISKDNGTLSDYVINYNSAIGIDSSNNQIYYYSKAEDSERLQKVNLNDVKFCDVEKVTKRIKSGKSEYESIQRIALVFTSQNNAILDSFEFYNNDDGSLLTEEIALAETWKKKVNEYLQNHRTTSNTYNVSATTLVFS